MTMASKAAKSTAALVTHVWAGQTADPWPIGAKRGSEFTKAAATPSGL